MGAAVALDASLRQTIDGQLVGDGHLPNAFELNSTSFFAGGLIGLAVAGLIIAKIETGWETFLNRLSFGADFFSIYRIRVHEIRTIARVSRASGGYIEGIRFVARARLPGQPSHAPSDREILDVFPGSYFHHGGVCLP